jgi:hypothetical protein
MLHRAVKIWGENKMHKILWAALLSTASATGAWAQDAKPASDATIAAQRSVAAQLPT